MQTEVFSFLMFGFVLGFKHALDPDHLVAVSSIVGERKGVFSSSMVGALWGVGHTASLLLVGVIVIALQVQIPARMAQGMEFAVALMLMILGINALRKLPRSRTLLIHAHEQSTHIRAHQDVRSQHSHTSLPSLFTFTHLKSHLRSGKRSVVIGMVHGLAGSATLMLIVLATIPTKAMALSYILIFGIGSVGGMFLMSMLIGLPFIFTQRAGIPHVLVRGLAGTVSIALGVFLAWQIGVANGLLTQQ